MQRSMIRFRFGFGGVFPLQIRLYQRLTRLIGDQQSPAGPGG
jgi:hypothetical protein